MAPRRPSRRNTTDLADLYVEAGPHSSNQIVKPPKSHPQESSETTEKRAPRKRTSTLGRIFSPSRIRRRDISSPSGIVHLTHMGLNTSTGEFVGLAKEWEEQLQESVFSRQEREKYLQTLKVSHRFHSQSQMPISFLPGCRKLE